MRSSELTLDGVGGFILTDALWLQGIKHNAMSDDDSNLSGLTARLLQLPPC